MSHDTTTAAAGLAPVTLRSLAHRIAGRFRIIRDGATDQSRAQRDAVTAFLVRVASAGLLYLSQIILARWMGGHEYGIYVFVWTWVLVLGGLSHLGLNLAAIRLVPEYRAKGQNDLLRGLLRGGRISTVAISTAIATGGMAALIPLQPYIDHHYVLPLYLGLVCLPLFTLTDVQDGIGRGFGWMSVALAPPYILRPLLLLVAMSLAYAAGLDMTATTAAGAAIAATWLTAIVQTIIVNRRIEKSVAAGERTYTFSAWFKFSFPLLVIGMADIVTQNADVLVVSRYMSPADVGIYFAAAKTMSLIMFVHFAVGSAVAHRFSALNASGDRAGLEAVVRDAVSWTVWPSLAGAGSAMAAELTEILSAPVGGIGTG
ncbi:MAG: lipopolysaccharide biosynthesis protein, partial [Hyphomicrobiaceae bacterium]